MTQKDNLLTISNLSIQYLQGKQSNYAVNEINISIQKGQSYALVGESGCGKSTVAMSILGLLKKDQTKIEGDILFKGKQLLGLPEKEFSEIRGNKISMIFQDPMTSLNPFFKVGEQIIEQIKRHKKVSSDEAKSETINLFNAVGISDSIHAVEKYPHEFSGGMRQRVMIASAMSCNPELLIADEPTTALDVTIQAQILKLIKEETKKRNMSLLLITHDLGVVAGIADNVAVMYAGKIVEEAESMDLFGSPEHPYTIGLLKSLPTKNSSNQRLYNIPGQPPFKNTKSNKCSFYDRCNFKKDDCKTLDVTYQHSNENHRALCLLKPPFPEQTSQVIDYQSSNIKTETLVVKNLVVNYQLKTSLFSKTNFFTAVNKVSITLNKGETLALVGESGCGKSSYIRGILQLIKPASGSITFNQKDITNCTPHELNETRKKMQIIFQDPYSSLNSRMKIFDIIAEPLKNLTTLSQNEIETRVIQLLEETGLQSEWLNRYPHQFSGGQRQRICIARALSLEPEILFCDEPVSALDVSIQAQILNLLQDLKAKRNLSMLFVSHDLAVVRQISDRVAVMYKGKIVEQGKTEEIFNNPMHPYTHSLIHAAPVADPKIEKSKLNTETIVIDEHASSSSGCSYANRCQYATEKCLQISPELKESANRNISCFFPLIKNQDQK